jgi:hypothetical protein
LPGLDSVNNVAKVRLSWPARTILIATGLFTIFIALVRKSGPIFFEGVLLTAILTLALSRPPLRDAPSSWPAALRIAGMTLVVLMLWGHLNGKQPDFYPFVPWNMYSTGEKREVISYAEYQGRRDDGSEVRFVPSAGAPVWVRDTILRMALDMNNVQLAKDRREWARRQFDGFGPLVLEMYNRENPERPIRGYKVYQNLKSLKDHPKVERVLVGVWPRESSQ